MYQQLIWCEDQRGKCAVCLETTMAGPPEVNVAAVASELKSISSEETSLESHRKLLLEEKMFLFFSQSLIYQLAPLVAALYYY